MTFLTMQVDRKMKRATFEMKEYQALKVALSATKRRDYTDRSSTS